MTPLRPTVLATVALLSLLAAPPSAAAQDASPGREFGGPRIGLTLVTGSDADRLDDELGIAPIMFQFGWQFESRLFTSATGLTGVTEWIPLVGALEQGKFAPSLSWLVGLRAPNGAEFALGPNVSLGGVGLAVAAGVSQRVGELSVPVNLALVPSGGGVRMSVLTGFYIRR